MAESWGPESFAAMSDMDLVVMRAEAVKSADASDQAFARAILVELGRRAKAEARHG